MASGDAAAPLLPPEARDHEENLLVVQASELSVPRSSVPPKMGRFAQVAALAAIAMTVTGARYSQNMDNKMWNKFKSKLTAEQLAGAVFVHKNIALGVFVHESITRPFVTWLFECCRKKAARDMGVQQVPGQQRLEFAAVVVPQQQQVVAPPPAAAPAPAPLRPAITNIPPVKGSAEELRARLDSFLKRGEILKRVTSGRENATLLPHSSAAAALTRLLSAYSPDVLTEVLDTTSGGEDFYAKIEHVYPGAGSEVKWDKLLFAAEINALADTDLVVFS